MAGYVLSNFDDGERRQLEELHRRAADMAETWAREGLADGDEPLQPQGLSPGAACLTARAARLDS